MAESHPAETVHSKRQRLALVPRACEGCKTRKVRCDRSIPCSNCRTSGITCEQVDPPPEKKPKPGRNTRLEEHVATLEERLRVLENELRSHRPASEHSTGSTPNTDTTLRSNARTIPVSNMPITLYEGDSSFSSQSAHAREAAETMANLSHSAAGSNLDATLHSLKSLLQPASQNNRASDTTTHQSTQIYLPLPVDLVLAMLRRYQEKKPLFLSSYPINDLSLLENICQKVYFPMRPVSAGTVAAMHGMFYFLMKESITMKDEMAKRLKLEDHIGNCKQSFEAAIEGYDVLTVPTFENIIALTLGVMKAQDESKPLVCCQTVSAAARHAQMLGYHRESTYKKDQDRNSESKRRIFWCIYVFDKMMSLLLGRASYIQDFDIDVQWPTSTSDPSIRPWDDAFCYMIKLSEVQDKVYNKLYSASALKAAPFERAKRIQELEMEMEKCRKIRYEIDTSKIDNPNLFDICQRTWDILYYSAMTSLLRASSSLDKGAEIGPRCFEAARMSLTSHLRCFPDYKNSDIFTISDYANWVLLYSSFTPFVVIFLHAIAATSMEDVNLLEEVVTTLQHARSVSNASERIYSIGANFARVARGLVEAQKSVGKYNEQEDSLKLSDNTRKAHVFNPDTTQDPAFGVDMMDYLTYPEAQDMSALFGSWDSGQPSAMELFGMTTNDVFN